MTPPIPDKLHTLTRTAIDNGWNVLVNHGIDTAGAPFVNVRLKNTDHDVHACWRTRSTGTYRWDGAIVDNRHTGVSYTRVLAMAQEAAQ